MATTRRYALQSIRANRCHTFRRGKVAEITVDVDKEIVCQIPQALTEMHSILA
jgi:hypothetical protein